MTQQEKVWTAEEFMEMSEAEFERVDENPLVLCRDGEVRRFDDTDVIYGKHWAIVGFDARKDHT